MAADRGPAGEWADAILAGTELTSSSEQTVFTELSPLDLYRTFDKEDAGRIDEARFTLCVKSLTGGLASTASSRAVFQSHAHNGVLYPEGFMAFLKSELGRAVFSAVAASQRQVVRTCTPNTTVMATGPPEVRGEKMVVPVLGGYVNLAGFLVKYTRSPDSEQPGKDLTAGVRITFAELGGAADGEANFPVRTHQENAMPELFAKSVEAPSIDPNKIQSSVVGDV